MAELLLLIELLFQPLPHRDLRYEWVVGQADWYTCGPAAVATLLTHYYGIATTEAEALDLAEGFMVAAGREPGQALTALALRQTLEAKGIPTRGYRVSPEALADYFARGGLPVILHLTEPQSNCVVGQVRAPSGFHGVLWWSMALRMTRSLRMQATRATLVGLPEARSRW